MRAGLARVYTDSERRELEAGGILISADGGGDRGRAHATGVVPAPVDVVWEVITDYDGYREFMPLTVLSRVEKVEGRTVLFRSELKILIKRIRYLLRLTLDEAAGRAEWEQIEGDLVANEGSWELSPYEGDRTLASYSVRLEIGFLVPEWVVEKMTRGTFPQLFRAVRERSAVILAAS